MIESFNTPLAIRTLGRIEMEAARGQHDQQVWAELVVDFDQFPTLDRDNPWSSGIVEVPSTIYDIETTCGTARCFAGWAQTEAGAHLLWEFDGYSVADQKVNLRADYVLDEEGNRVTVMQATQDLLVGGFESLPMHVYDTIPALFHQSNSIDDLYEMVADYSGLEEETLRAEVQQIIPTLRAEDREKARQVAAKQQHVEA